MNVCKLCGGEKQIVNYPAFPNTNDKDKLKEINDFCEKNIKFPCPNCQPLEYDVYKLKNKLDVMKTRQNRFEKQIENTIEMIMEDLREIKKRLS